VAPLASGWFPGHHQAVDLPERTPVTYRPRQYWDRRAWSYLRFEHFRTLREALLAPLRIRLVRQELERVRPQSLLEVGCGPGRNLPLYRRIPRVACVDFSPPMLERARARAGRLGLTQVEFGEMACQDLRLAERSFELVLTTVVLLHIPPADIQRAVSELVRVSARWVLINELSSVDPGRLARWPSMEHVFVHDYRRLFDQAGARLRHVKQVAFRPQEVLLFEVG
jgi:ubiquinone/menaquinone biosynthesis C-methylase UbiE